MAAPRPSVWSESAGDTDSEPVVLVHGSMDRSAGLLRFSRRIDHRFHVVRYDRRGYGRSAAVGRPWTVAANVEDLADLVRRSAPSGRPALLFGHSFGGNVALALADQHPELVRAVAVYETPLSWLDWWPGSTAGGAAMSASDPGEAAEAFMRRLVGDAVWERLPASKQAERRAEGAAMVEELADLRRVVPWTAAAVRVPVLAMFGEAGRPHHRTAMEFLAQSLADARSCMVPAAGHAGPHSHADEVAAAFVDFVNSLPSPTSTAAQPAAGD
jgi:pimeloyl-ACP methyl ester carboxylesterase